MPARISSTQRVRLASSPPTVMSSSSFQSASRSAFSSGSSASASWRISGSSPCEHLRGLGDLGVELLEAAVLGGQLGQRAVLAGDGRHPRRIGQHRRIDELPFQLLEAGEVLFQLIAHGIGRHGRSRPAADPTSRLMAAPTAFAVRLVPPGRRFGRRLLLAALQAGVAGRGELLLELLDAAGRVDVLQLAGVEGVAGVANIDLQLRPCVLRVTNVLPQPQVTLVSTYLG